METLFLTDTESDILIIIDCCKAASGVRRRRSRQYGKVEVLAACSFADDTPLSGKHTFTAHLILELRDRFEDCMKLQHLYSNLLYRLKQCYQPDSNRRVYTIYYCLADTDEDRSIRLWRQPTPSNKLYPRPPILRDAQNTVTTDLPLTRGSNPQVSKSFEESVLLESRAIFRHNSVRSITVFGFSAAFLKALKIQINDTRYFEISEAHQDTSAWALRGHFAEWLRSGNDLFWISGQPGSGKSTLMKAILDNGRTGGLLQTWAGVRQLNIAYYFLWNSGSHSQRSLHGLRGALLFQMLAQRPDLIPLVAQHLGWTSSNAFCGSHPNGWEHPANLTSGETLSAFNFVLSCYANTDSACLCVFIDALDECEDDLQEVAALTTGMANLTNVKICASSRAWSIFCDRFQRSPSLRLQDLTFNDIELFVRSSLLRFKTTQCLEEEDLSELISTIVEKGKGVFLWVRLVHSIIRGFQNVDSMSELRQMLDDIPDDLQELYKNILWRRIKSVYLPRASEIFQILRASQIQVIDRESGTRSEPLLTLKGLYFAMLNEGEQQNRLFHCPVQPLTEGELEAMKTYTYRTVIQCTADFLSLENEGDPLDTNKKDGSSLVSYYHQTAKQFLEEPETWDALLQYTDGTDFSAQFCILKSAIIQIKTLDLGRVAHSVSEEVRSLGCWALLDQAMTCASLTSDMFPQQIVDLLDELDRIMTTQLRVWSNNTIYCHWSSLLPLDSARSDGRNETFLALAISYGLYPYVEAKLTKDISFGRGLVSEKRGRPLLDYALRPQSELTAQAINPKVVAILLEYGADPNQCFRGESVLSRFIEMYDNLEASSDASAVSDQRIKLHEIRELLLVRDE